MAKKPHLGRGLSALLGGDEAALEPSAQRNVPIEYLHPGKYQPRGKFDPAELDSLAQSIRENGVLQPILVRPDPGKGGLEIIAGERRWRAAQLAQLHEVPIIERSLDDREALEIALVENVQRQDLTPIEQAEAYGRLMSEFRYTQEILAEKIGKSRSSIANLLRLRDLPVMVRTMLGDGRLSEGHGRALLGALDPEALAREIVAKGLNVRQVEDLVKREKKRPKFRDPKTAVKPAKDADTRALEHDLSLKLGLKVEIEFDGKGGRVVLQYASLDQLDGLVEKLNA
jgi:ParB family transcriptional regulator, chromosome partitioning protein